MKWTELSKRQQCLLGVAAALLLVVFVGVFSEDASMTEATEANDAVSEALAPKKEVKNGKWKVLGAEKSGETKELRDPFTLLHEGKGAVPVEAREKAALKEAQAENIVGRASVLQEGREKQEKEVRWKLQGIVAGEKGRLAIVGNGKETYTVGEGDSFAGNYVRKVSEEAVVLEADGRESALYLKGI